MRIGRRSIGVALTLTIGLAPSVAAATTVRVDDDGKASASSCNATKRAPKTIQAGIKAAGKNGTVIVCPGTYRGTIVIDGTRDGITVVGATGATSKVLPPAGGLGANQPLVRIASSADNVTLKRLAFRSPAADCAVSEVTGSRVAASRCWATASSAATAASRRWSAPTRPPRARAWSPRP